MMEVISINEAEKWDEIVRTFSKYDIYYLSGYVNAFQIHDDGEPELFFFENAQMKAINVVMKRDIANCPHFESIMAKGEWFDYSTPYGYGGFLMEGLCNQDNLSELNREYTTYCINNNVVSEFVRFHPILKNAVTCFSMYDAVNLGLTVAMDLSSKETIWSDISSKNRNVIRKAQKKNVKIYWGRNEELFSKFIEIYNQTMDRNHANSCYYFKPEFYDSVLNDLKYQSLIFYAMLDNEIIAMSIILFCNGQMHYHLSASKVEYLKFAPSNLLLYEVACWGCENGYHSLHLGGGIGSQMDGLYKFKKAFNRNAGCQFSIGKKIFNEEKYKELCRVNYTDRNTSFFPAYRG